MKLESDRRNETDYFTSKFTGKVSEIFSGLPKPKDPISFTTNDLPLLFTADEVQRRVRPAIADPRAEMAGENAADEVGE